MDKGLKEHAIRKFREDTAALNAIGLIAMYCDEHNCGACAIDKYCEALELHNEMPIMYLIGEVKKG